MRFLFVFLFRAIRPYIFAPFERIQPVFWCFFIIFLITSAITYKFYHIKHTGGQAYGEVVESEQTYDDGSPNPKWVRFTTEDGQELHADLFSPVFYDTGEEIKVFYDKKHPINNYADTFWNAYGIFLLGLIVLIIGAYIAVSSPKPRKEKYESIEETEDHNPFISRNDGCSTVFLKVIAILMMIVGVTNSIKYYSLKWRGETVIATVVTAQRPGLSSPHQSTAKNLYYLDKNNMPVFIDSIKLEDYELGDEINLLYNPDNPSDLITDDALHAYGLLLVALILIGYAWGPGLVWRFFHRMKDKLDS
jgi:hypothetical protein